MTRDARVLELLARWETLRAQGQVVSPEELCDGDAALLNDLRQHLARFQGLEPALSRAGETATLPPPAGPERGTAEAARPLLPGYEMLGELGRGGMGVVYKARQIKLDRLVAVKMILAGAHAGPEQLQRFCREAEAVARLQHPQIVQIHEIGDQHGLPYFTLEYVAGGSLAQKTAGAPLPARQAAALVEMLAQAVHYAHEHGVLHRDLKPANVLLTADGTPKITDFGLAKRLDQAGGQTQSGTVMGTPSYMAPEQAGGRSKAIGPAADVYALGAILYELLTGRPPFQGPTPLDTLMQVLAEEPVPLTRLQSRVPRDLETICLKCLHKEPARRYGTAEALAAELGRFLRGEPILARPVGLWELAWRWCRRNPGVAALTTSVALLLLAGTTISCYFAAQAEARAREAIEDKNQAQTEKDRADQQTLSARRHLYAAHMALAQRYWDDLLVDQLLDLLDEERPERNGGTDLRGFEWYYWWRLYHSDLLTLRGHTGAVNGVSFSPTGQRLATASADRTVKVWDAQSGHEAFSLKGHAADITAVAFSPDGTYLASASADRTVKVWDARTGREIRSLAGREIRSPAGLPGADHCLALSGDGTRLAVGTSDYVAPGKASHGELTIWEVATGRKLKTLTGHHEGVTGVAFSPDGSRLTTSSVGGTVVIWDSKTGREILTFRRHSFEVFAVAFSPDGQRLASASRDFPNTIGEVKVWDSHTGNEVLSLKGHKEAVSSIVFSPDGKSLASGSWDDTARVWDLASGQEVFCFRGHLGDVTGVAFSPDGARLASSSRDQTVKIWDARAGQESRLLRVHPPTEVRHVAFDPTCRTLVSGSGDGTAKIWDVTTGKLILTVDGLRGQSLGLALGPGNRLAGIAKDGTLRIWDATTGKTILTLARHQEAIDALAFSADGRRLAGGAAGGRVTVWDVEAGRELQTWQGHLDHVQSVAFSPDGQRLATASSDFTAKVWEADTGKEIHDLAGHASRVTGVAFSPDARFLATTSYQEIKVWEALTGRELRSLAGHSDVVYGVAFSPDGHRLVTGGDDQMVKVWDLATGNQVLSLKGHSSRVTRVAFSPDGRRLASASEDGTARIWEAAAPDSSLWVQREALHLVDSLFYKLVRRAEVVESVRHDPNLPEPLRRETLTLAKDYPQNPGHLNNASWVVVRQPKAAEAAYHRALLQAEVACEIEPNNGLYVNTLGVALYRAGRHAEALETLSRSEGMNAAQFNGPIPADLAFLAMAQHRLGKHEAARQTLARLRQAAKGPRWATHAEAQAFVQEAEKLLQAPARPPSK